jgi:hypothetical protein
MPQYIPTQNNNKKGKKYIAFIALWNVPSAPHFFGMFFMMEC